MTRPFRVDLARQAKRRPRSAVLSGHALDAGDGQSVSAGHVLEPIEPSRRAGAGRLHRGVEQDWSARSWSRTVADLAGSSTKYRGGVLRVGRRYTRAAERVAQPTGRSELSVAFASQL